MKNSIFIHKTGDVNKISFRFIFALLPLVIYGIYKNGILLYLDDSINFINMFKPFLLPFIGVLCGLIVNYINTRKFKYNNFILYGMLVGMNMPINTNIIVFAVSLLIFMYIVILLDKKLKINPICIMKILIVLTLVVFNSYEYANISEINSVYAISFIDIIFGRGVGGCCSTSIVLIIIGFCYLLTDYYYKKEIPITAFLTYTIICIISYALLKDFNIVIGNIINSAPLFAFAFIAPISIYSSYTKKGKILFGGFIGILTGVLTLFLGIMEAPIISIGVASLLKNYFDNCKRQKTLK